jgi:hypothetical protein
MKLKINKIVEEISLNEIKYKKLIGKEKSRILNFSEL